MTVCADATAETVEGKLAVFASAGTVTEAGTVTALLLLAKLMAKPSVVAAVFNVTVQLSVPAPVIELLTQLSAVSTGTPVPVNATEELVPVEELLLIVNAPFAGPAAVGSNCTVSVAV